MSCWPGIFPTCQDPFSHRHKGTVGPLGLPGYWGEPARLDTAQHPLVSHCLGTSSTETLSCHPTAPAAEGPPQTCTRRSSSALGFGLGPPWRPARQLLQTPPAPSPPRSAAEAPACPRPTLGSQHQRLDLGSHLCSHVRPGCELCAQMHVVGGRRGAL